MKPTLLIALALVGALLAWSAVSFVRNKTVWHFLRFAGAGFLAVTVLAHACEELGLLPSMGWGAPHSIGHYLDLSSFVLGIALLVLGYAGIRFIE